ncbi:MAG: MerR family transcriptional regulator [Ginsengibacter sp.]
MQFTIKDIENLSGVKAHTIRIWEQRYSFLRPGRTEKNLRLYDDEQLKTILNIALLNKHGFKISHIDKMSEEGRLQKIMSLPSAEAKNEVIINNLIDQMNKVDMKTFEECIDAQIKTQTIEKTLLQIIFPFLERIGVLWLTSHINPAQEHLVSNIIRQKIIVGIETLNKPKQSTATICMFLPEGEYHELSLLFITYLLKKAGVEIIYLGASIPLIDVEFIVRYKKPDYLFSHLTSITQKFNFETFLNSLHSSFPSIPIIISGKLTTVYSKKIPENIHFKKSAVEILQFIETF